MSRKGAALRGAAGMAMVAWALALPSTARAQTCSAPGSTDFERVPIVTGLTLPMAFQEAADGRIFFIERPGDVKVYTPVNGLVQLVGHVPVNTDAEFGLLGMALDPAFAVNHYMYLYYAAPGAGYETHVSRFTITDSPLGIGSESVMLTIPHILNFHVAGDMNFGPDGNLYISTGSNDFAFGALYPGCAFGSAESDCAIQTSSNTNDLRGKVLRVTPTAAGGYAIPSGNMFPGDATHRPEIYSMGNRNPFRFSVDNVGGAPVVYLAEVGSRYEEINRIASAGYYGWPLYEGPNNYYSKTTGLTPRTPWLWYHQDDHTSSFPIPNIWDAGISAGRSVMAGPVYHYHPGISNPKKLPLAYDGDLIFWDFSKGLIWNADIDSGGNITNINTFLSGVGFGPAANTNGQNGTMDMAVAADDTLLVLEYWSGKLYRVNYIGPGVNRTPIIAASATPATNGGLPLSVTFSACPGAPLGCTSDPEGDPMTYQWDFNGDGVDEVVGGAAQNPPPYSYGIAGTYNARLRVSDNHGNTATQFFTITAGNHAPVVTFSNPPDGGFFQWGDDVNFDVSVSDSEDGSTPVSIPCSSITVQTAFGHDGHDHGGDYASGCSGTFNLGHGVDDPEHANVYYILASSYTDHAVGAAPALTTKASLLLHPKRKEVEFASQLTGVSVGANTDPWTGGEGIVTDIDDGDYLVLPGRNLQNMNTVKYRVAAGSAGGFIQLRLDGPAGTRFIASTRHRGRARSTPRGTGSLARCSTGHTGGSGRSGHLSCSTG